MTERVRQVIILTVGAVWKSDYERYAHSAVARKAGLSEATVRALAQGEDATELTEEERIAQRFTKQLTAKHQIDDELYAKALTALRCSGHRRPDLLAGCYDTISALLNAFRVPVPE